MAKSLVKDGWLTIENDETIAAMLVDEGFRAAG
jgi:hypothetical protein